MTGMLWLFGQIWLWLIVSFALGAAATWLLMRALQRRQPQENAYEPPPLPEEEPEERSAERTQFIPAPPFTPSEPLLDYRFSDDEPYDEEPDGHREGSLPLPPPRPAPAADDWPTEEEPIWPAAEDLDATRRWPGRSG